MVSNLCSVDIVERTNLAVWPNTCEKIAGPKSTISASFRDWIQHDIANRGNFHDLPNRIRVSGCQLCANAANVLEGLVSYGLVNVEIAGFFHEREQSNHFLILCVCLTPSLYTLYRQLQEGKPINMEIFFGMGFAVYNRRKSLSSKHLEQAGRTLLAVSPYTARGYVNSRSRSRVRRLSQERLRRKLR